MEPKEQQPNSSKVALITGAARRLGAEICSTLHQQGYNIALHYHHSKQEAEELAHILNKKRSDSVALLTADLNQMSEVEQLAQKAASCWGRLDLLINNASSFYPTPLETSNQNQWDELINSNLRAPYFLCAALCPALKQHKGSIINLIDIHAQRALPGHPIYSIAKAGLQMMTLSLAKELAPDVRVNGVAPGAILWPEQGADPQTQQQIINKTLLQRLGSPKDIAEAVLYLSQANYVTGHILNIDGGKSLYSH